MRASKAQASQAKVRARARIGPFRLCARIALLRARASRFLLILDICKWHYEFKLNESESILHQSYVAQLIERLISV